jgi:hypothetical protein
MNQIIKVGESDDAGFMARERWMMAGWVEEPTK